jgi:hypothetical protein
MLELLRRLIVWLTTYKDPIGCAAAIGGVVIGLVGFGATIYQLRSTAAALRATNSYQIQKDARELVDKIQSDPSFAKIMQQGPNTNDPAQELTFSNGLWKLANFYLSVDRQWKAGGISSGFYESYVQDFCGLLRNKYVSTEWDKMLSDGRLNSAERDMRAEWCHD